MATQGWGAGFAKTHRWLAEGAVASPGPASPQDLPWINAQLEQGRALRFGRLAELPSCRAMRRSCAAPNADTLYTEAWLDVSKEPWVVAMPDMGDRYFILPFLSGWSEVIKVASPATTGGKAQTFVVTGPGWKGTLPKGVTQVKSPTGMVWLLGRIYSSGTPEDYAAVHVLQDRFSVMPLAAWGQPYTPAAGTVDAAIDMKTAGRTQVNALDVEAYFTRLAQLMS